MGALLPQEGPSPDPQAPALHANLYRIANYLRRKAEHEAARIVSSEIVKF